MGDERVRAHNGYGEAPRVIALGRTHLADERNALDAFAQRVGGLTWKQWEGAGLVPRGQSINNFSAAFEADEIHFNLRGVTTNVDSIMAASFSPGTMTLAELKTILSRPDLFRKTTWYFY